MYLRSTGIGLNSPNIVSDFLFRTSPRIGDALATETSQERVYSVVGPTNKTSPDDCQYRTTVASNCGQLYETQATTMRSILEWSYPRLRVVYTVNYEYNHINNILVFGYILMAVVILFSLGGFHLSNVTFLAIWTTVDPLFWERVEVSDTVSYGTCSVDGAWNAWTVILACIAAINGVALLSRTSRDTPLVHYLN